ncbi:MAG: NADH-quinone oxidoreductase subunit C, partial [Armatimonadota bacterium]|nr:NADH-quinone oxidoreductase subunit C [Armatimonadota bacterium]
RGDLTVTVAREVLAEVCQFLRDAHGFTYPILVSGVDREEHLESVCHLGHPADGRVVVVKARLPLRDPRVPSITPLFAGMNWHERESFDLMGIDYVGHPDQRRILLFDEWDDYPHPLRKEFKLRPFSAKFVVSE